MVENGCHLSETLKSVVLDKKLLKDIGKHNQLCHTGILEVYHSILLNCCPERLHFGYKGTQLTALDHINNVDRSQATTHEQERYKVVFIKLKGCGLQNP